MRNIDSLSNHSIDSKSKKASWDSLSSGSNDWNILKPIDEVSDSDSLNRNRPLDFPDSWKKLDLPHEVSEMPIQSINHTPEEEMEARKRIKDAEQRGQELLDMLDQEIIDVDKILETKKQSDSAININGRNEVTEQDNGEQETASVKNYEINNTESIEQERLNAGNDLLIAIAKGEMTIDNENQQKTYKYIRGLLEQKCKELDVDYETINFDEICDKKISDFCNQLNQENHTSFTFTFRDFNKQLGEYLSRTDLISPDKRLFYFDSLTKVDTFSKGGTTGIFAIMNQYLNMENLSETVNALIINDNTTIAPEIQAIFGDPEPKAITSEEQEKAKRDLEEFVTKYEIGKLYSVRKAHSQDIAKKRESIYMDIETEKNPDFVEALKELKSNQDVTYFFHGSAGQAISQQINSQGLYMQYNDIERTAKPNLTPYELLTYKYGHDSMGLHAITIIGVPKGEYVVEENRDNIAISGTSQGAEQGDFVSKYKIPKRYIYGYIDKDNKEVVKNPDYVDPIKKR
ncbi:hypothetical protein IKD67_02630 [Candidatus Saccharibacteria bacterium]|nr:hypothetical protein [Candidatus Saccharibacteria bacterium]